jgi:phosphatidate cytidylyltransferase
MSSFLSRIAVAAAGLPLVLFAAYYGRWALFALAALAALLALHELYQMARSLRPSTTVAVGTTVLGAAWIGLGLGHLVLVRDLEPDGRLVLITVLVTVFVADTLAFVGGRLAGRHKMAPAISPGKTWEGFVAGLVGGVLTPWIAFNKEPIPIDGWEAFAFGGVVVLAAVAGDLFESMVKRDLGVKDSGRFLLGHGGVLDRVDSLVFAGPAAYFAVLALT